MADPWTDDLAALGEQTRSQLRSIAATRASVLSHQETKMNLFKRRPLFAILVTLAIAALATPVALAIGSRVFVTVDPDQSPGEIEHQVQQQLEQAGINAKVHADKVEDRVEVHIDSDDPRISSDLSVGTPGASNTAKRQVRVELSESLDDAQLLAAQSAMTSDHVLGVLAGKGGYSDAQITAIIQDALTSAGFTGVKIHIDARTIIVRVPAPAAR